MPGWKRETQINKNKSTWFKLLWMVPAGLVLLALMVLVARFLRELPAVQSFMQQYPGTSALPGNAPVGFPAWLGWQHFLNFFFLLLIIRSGWVIHAGSARGFWTPRARRARGPFPAREQGARLSLGIWWHLSLDVLWIVNGLVFFVLLFATGQWMRLVPLRWDVFPNAISVAIQYASLEWPLESGWVNYNGLQLIAYFMTVFIAAPLALITGLRTSPAGLRITRFPISVPVARKLHFYVMVWFAAFTFVHVVLVFATGALNNLNHMYAGRNDDNWVGFWIFALSMVIAIVAWIAATPFTIRFLASLSGKVTR